MQSFYNAGIFEGLWFSSAGQQQQLTQKNRFACRPQPWRPPPPPSPPPASPPCPISPTPPMHRYDSPDQLLQSSPDCTMVDFPQPNNCLFNFSRVDAFSQILFYAATSPTLGSSTKSISSHIHLHQLKTLTFCSTRPGGGWTLSKPLILKQRAVCRREGNSSCDTFTCTFKSCIIHFQFGAEGCVFHISMLTIYQLKRWSGQEKLTLFQSWTNISADEPTLYRSSHICAC